jgi:hypothetical protein
MSAFRKFVPGAVCAAALILTGMPAQAATPEPPAGTLAAAPTCWATNITNNSDLKTTLKGNYNLKDGVGKVCGNVRSVSKGSTFYVWCGVLNPDSGALWFLGRVKGDPVSKIGYMSADNLEPVNDGGTWSPC